eukprot:11043200-Ditylum_brightwellii.AAC.1
MASSINECIPSSTAPPPLSDGSKLSSTTTEKRVGQNESFLSIDSSSGQKVARSLQFSPLSSSKETNQADLNRCIESENLATVLDVFNLVYDYLEANNNW